MILFRTLLLLLILSACSTYRKIEEHCIKYPTVGCSQLLEDYGHYVLWSPWCNTKTEVDSMNVVMKNYWKAIKREKQ